MATTASSSTSALEGEDDGAHADRLKALELAGHPVVAHRHDVDRPYRPGILPLRDRDRGRRRGDRHQPVRPAGRRGHQDQDARTDRRVREDRLAAGGRAGGLDRRGRSLYRRAQRRRAAQGRRQRHARLVDQGASGARRRAATTSPCSPISSATRGTIGALQTMRMAVRDAQASSRPAPSSGRASCTRPGRPTRAGPTAACSCRSPPTTPRTWRCPGQKASFGIIKAAQARGDFDVLTERGRRALRVHLKGDLGAGLSAARCRHLRSAALKEIRTCNSA